MYHGSFNGVSRGLQGCFKGNSQFLRLFKFYSGFVGFVSKRLQGTLRKFEGCFSEIWRVHQKFFCGGFKENSRGFKKISRLFQGCFLEENVQNQAKQINDVIAGR